MEIDTLRQQIGIIKDTTIDKNTNTDVKLYKNKINTLKSNILNITSTLSELTINEFKKIRQEKDIL
jgi:hypothetical protein